ncbi:MAG: 4-alpha-glucanotransferase [Bacteroidia bacterium]|nr:4-alpha-glucanotransferase [Bacteroidia bacterium]
MKLRFRVQYTTSWGQSLYVSGSSSELGNWDLNAAQPMRYLADGYWELSLLLAEKIDQISYKFFVKHEYGGGVEWEFGDNRTLSLPEVEEVVIQDGWRGVSDEENALYSSLFTDTLLQRSGKTKATKVEPSDFAHRFGVYAPRVLPTQSVAILGSDPALGGWNPSKAIPLSDAAYPLWETEISLQHPDAPLEYKFVIIDNKTKKIISWENGSNRSLAPEYSHVGSRYVSVRAEAFRHPWGQWRGTGVAIPVFSLRSQQGTGIGEFSDLKLLIDWASLTGMSMIQILPINDTVATHTWTDSYPYAAISVFALHPMYANLEQMGRLQNAEAVSWWEDQRDLLNALPEVDYEEVMKVKTHYFKMLFDQEWHRTAKSKAFKAFFKENEAWLLPYAVFSQLRDKYKTVKYAEWPEFHTYDAAAIKAYAAPDQDHHLDIAIHYFIQFHLDKQIGEVKEYAGKKRVGIKGDIPIGIYRHSVDAWMAPHLYNMNGQAGAPPDAFATAGQNWGFPTYDWNEMAKDGFAWWRMRLTQLSRYFDAFRIDHILGFFRIWQVPYDQIQGILGQFNPALPFHRDELAARGVWFDETRFARPYIREHFLAEFLGEFSEAAAREFLQERPDQPGCYDFKPEFATQRQIQDYISRQTAQWPESKPFYEGIKEGLFGLVADVIFLPYPGSEGYSPRIAMHFTKSYQELDPGTKAALDELYVDFFYHRHEQFWRDQAMVKLPAIKEATNMLVCGEDLGMVPKSVPGVMRELGILSLEIQRMPKDSAKVFDHPGDAPYLSVVSTSTHDMATIRGWWEEDHALSQQFFSQILGHHEAAPFFCEPWIAREIIIQHLYSPAMWAILPIQDLLAIDGELRRENPLDEQINVPANPQHYWRYRLHLTLEELLKAEGLNRSLSGMIAASGRN